MMTLRYPNALLFLLLFSFSLSLLTINTGIADEEPEQDTVTIQATVSNFEFQRTDEVTRSLSNYAEKQLIVIHWGASWCPICKTNNAAIASIYSKYTNDVNFLSINYGKSGDDLDDVVDDKGTYQWDFGLDVNDYAGSTEISPKPRNAHTWVIKSSNLEVVKIWSYQRVSSSQLSNEIDKWLNDNTMDQEVTTPPPVMDNSSDNNMNENENDTNPVDNVNSTRDNKIEDDKNTGTPSVEPDADAAQVGEEPALIEADIGATALIVIAIPIVITVIAGIAIAVSKVL